jgi:hypothetical protein
MATKTKSANSKRYNEKLSDSLNNPAINPAMIFLSGTAEPQQEQKAPPPSLPPETKPRTIPQRRERRCRRANLLFTPSLFEKLTAVAGSSGMSVNDYVNWLVEDALK